MQVPSLAGSQWHYSMAKRQCLRLAGRHRLAERRYQLNIYESGSELVNKQWPENPYWLTPYIPQSSIVILYGQAGLGKSATTWQMAQAIQRGDVLWGLPTQQANVLYIELDTPENLMANRFNEAEPKFVPEFTIVTDDTSWDYRQFTMIMAQAEHEQTIANLKRLHKKYNFGVVFVDAIRDVIPGDLSASGIARKVYDAFRFIFPASTIVFVHHERKSGQAVFGGGNGLQAASGNMEFINKATVALQFHRKGRETWLEHGKSQGSALFEPLPLSLSDDGVHVFHRNHERFAAADKIMRDNPNASMRELDKLIGEALGVKERTGRIIRTAMQQQRKAKESS